MFRASSEGERRELDKEMNRPPFAVPLAMLRPAEAGLPRAGGDDSRPSRPTHFCAALAVIGFVLVQICDQTFVDPDLWHEMALFREAIREGRMPLEDRFAYTPTVAPCVHHEWGAGAIFYLVATTLGAPGLMTLKYALVAGVAAACCRCARQRGASLAVFLTLAPVMVTFSSYGFTTIRAQLFTMLLLTVMLCLLEVDARGQRWWIALWLPLYLVWLNVHAGFVVGAGLMALHACEQFLRRRPFRHFLPVGAAMAGLLLINPYGLQYVPYLMHGLTMARPLIVEWQPLWQADHATFSLYLASLLVIGYAGVRLGIRKLTGILVLAATAYAALRHTRHLSLYCVAWLCYVPGYLQQTALGELIEDVWRRRSRWIAGVSTLGLVLCLIRVLPAAPWQLRIPVTTADEQRGLPVYPAGAVDYLERSGFRGNLMVSFVKGGYVMWKLHPHVKVSLDGRYEVAYQVGILEENHAFYQARPGWQQTLAKYPTDAVLVARSRPLADELPAITGWTRTYRDPVYDLYTRPGLMLPREEQHAAPIRPRFP